MQHFSLSQDQNSHVGLRTQREPEQFNEETHSFIPFSSRGQFRGGRRRRRGERKRRRRRKSAQSLTPAGASEILNEWSFPSRAECVRTLEVRNAARDEAVLEQVGIRAGEEEEA
ncbi:unnamed protein product [Pleuronectes platessa]|uniref:Uncharacterized protein n=1 Tax=Pleuronectes platessa TaxID=8262 RepID=A0A9N7TJ07_PLEPL|nr:unnamed protein product [Pleuronectes platessa]